MDTRFRSQSTKIYDHTGQYVLYDVYGDIQRTIVPLDKINTNIQQATIAIEDAEFYQHSGIKPRAILRAVYANFTSGGYAQGGSTITQQVVKNALLSQEKTITRKVKEWILAIKLERVKSKNEILELYLNDAPYGGNIVGVEEASMGYFGKHASAVDLAEAAYLAALPQSPTRLRPHGGDVAALNARKNLVLKRMKELGMITADQEKQARGEVVRFDTPQDFGGSLEAPHFVMEVKQRLEDEYGEEYVKNGGLKVITTLDLDLQRIAEDTIAKHRNTLQSNFNADNSALVSLDPKTGQVLALVGSRDYREKGYGMFNVVNDGRRQPGSSFKPIIYSEAFREGYLPSTVVFDAQTSFDTRCDIDATKIPENNTECYRPKNYDGTYHGPISLRNALAQSLNVPAVKMLYLVGIKKSLALAKDLGITTLDHADRFGLSLVLGAGEVSPLEMAQAYGAFAHEGVLQPAQMIERVEDKDGKIIKEYTSEPREVLPPQVTRLLSDVLSDNVARTPAYGVDSALHFSDRQVAVKTGTTNDSRDYWVIGYTPSVVAVVWAGNHDNTPMVKKAAGFAVAPIWRDYLDEVFKKFPERFPKDERFVPPDPIAPNTKPALRGVWMSTTPYDIDTRTGVIADASVPVQFREQKLIPNVGEAHDILFFVNKDDPTGPVPSNPGNDEQFARWEFSAQKWLKENGIPGSALITVANSTMREQTGPSVEIIIDEANADKVVSLLDKYKVQTKVTSVKTVERVDFFLDGQFLGSVRQPPYEFAFSPAEHQLSAGIHTIRVVAVDADGISGETSMEENFIDQTALETSVQ
ncbi:MAG TPA: PBP1A family penicillin-binding protein [Candidatus Paceibacterota bacterium]|nr:PBP1A family penicillin-binding protein [Candidatus Paceibacterota bacterium]